MGAQLKPCQLSFSKSLFAGVLKTGVNSRKKCHGNGLARAVRLMKTEIATQ